jgi:hypothetical protein
MGGKGGVRWNRERWPGDNRVSVYLWRIMERGRV